MAPLARRRSCTRRSGTSGSAQSWARRRRRRERRQRRRQHRRRHLPNRAQLPMLGRRRGAGIAPRRATRIVAGRARRHGHRRGRDRQVPPRGDTCSRQRRPTGPPCSPHAPSRPRGRSPTRRSWSCSAPGSRAPVLRGVSPVSRRPPSRRSSGSCRCPPAVHAGAAAAGPPTRRPPASACSRRSRRSSRRSSAVPSRASSRSRTCSGRTTRRARRSSTLPGGSRGGRCSCCSRGVRRTSRVEPRRSRTRCRACPASTSVRLDRLDDVVVGALVDAAVAAGLPAWDAAALAAESEGLPLYVVEALMAGPGADGHAPPRGVRALLRERLASVSETAGQVLAAAAVIGRSFDFATVRAASGRSDDETVTSLEELVRRGIVREVASGREPAFDFGHARLRDAAYERRGLARRRLLHRRVAEALRAEPAGRDDPGRLALIAGHEQAAGRDAAAAEAYREAGLGSRRVYANREALEHLETALALGHPDVAGLQVAIGEVRTALGDYAGAIASLEAAAGVAGRGGAAGGRAAAGAGPRPARGRGHGREPPRRGAGRGGRAAPTDGAGGAGSRRPAGRRPGPGGLARGRGARTPWRARTTRGRRVPPAGSLGLVALRRGDLDAARIALRQAVDAAGSGPDGDPAPRSPPGTASHSSRRRLAITTPRSRSSRKRWRTAGGPARRTSRRRSRTTSRTSCTPPAAPTRRWRTSSAPWRCSPRSVADRVSWSPRSGSSCPGELRAAGERELTRPA